MPKSLKWSPRSIREYDNLIGYLSDQWSDDVALRVMLEMEQSVQSIQNSPEHYPVFLKGKKIRRCVASPQTSIFFKVYDEEIELISVFDNRQNPKKRKL